MVDVPPRSIRGWQAGPDGMEMIAFAGHGGEAEMIQGGWTDP